MNTLHSVSQDGSRTPDFEDPYDMRYETKWEATPIKPFKTQNEYLYAMVEDLAEWLNNLYSLDINPDNFFEKLETGTVLCQHANNMRRVALEYRQMYSSSDKDIVINDNDIKFRVDAKEGSFNARDNISNFITWCRHSMNIKDVLLFESDDLVLRKNERSFILCLLEVARRGGKVGMPVPLLVQFEEDIEREINAGLMERTSEFSAHSEADSEPSIEPASPTSSATTTDVDHELESDSDADHEMDSQRSESPDLNSLNGNNNLSSIPSQIRKGSKRSRLPKPLPQTMQQNAYHGSDGYGSAEVEQEQGPPPQVMLEPEILKSLHERVRELVNECTCPNQFHMLREAEGKYRIGDQSTLIFVRILRSHVMVRIGGGWDTLEHYLDKHDPCKCRLHRSGGRSRNNSFSTNYRRSPKRKVSIEGPKLYSRNQSVESLDDCESRSNRSPSPRMKRDDSNETLASLDSNHSTDLHNGYSPTKGRTGSITLNSPSRSSLQAEKRPSQLPQRLSQVGTGTEEFLRKRREEASPDAQCRQGNLARSAPTSPTRHVRPLSCTPIDLNETNVHSDVYRRLALAGGRESGSATCRRNRSSSVNLTNNPRSRETSLERGIPTSPTMRRKHRSGSLNVSTSRAESKRLADRRDNAVIMISRDTGGRHRLNSTSSCDSSDLRSHEGSSLRSPTDSEKSATECMTQRLRERERTRSLSVDRNINRTKIPSFERGSRLRTSTGVGEGRATRSQIPAFERGSRLRASTGVTERSTMRTQIPAFERGSKLRSTTGSTESKVRPRSATGLPSRSTRSEDHQGAATQNVTSKLTKEGPFQRTGSLRNPRTDRRLFNNPSHDQEGFTRNSPRRRTITGRETKSARQPVPAELNAENLAKYLQNYQSRVMPRETRSETRSNASSRASSRASSPGTSRLRPRIPIPSHLKAEPKTPVRKDNVEHAQPSRIPIPVQHKRLLSSEGSASRSHSLPDLIANMMDWCQRTINIDNYDTRSFTSADSMSPTPSLRTDQDSGYEDNPQKGSPIGPDDPFNLRRAGRSASIAEGEEAPVIAKEARGASAKRH